jgi:hypothetical protein
MTACLCALTLSLLSALGSDLGSTVQFTAAGEPEANPLARPFVEGRGAKGEAWLGGITAGAYLAVDRTVPEPWRSLVLGAAFAAHTTLAIRNVRGGAAHEVPPIVFPVLVLRW